MAVGAHSERKIIPNISIRFILEKIAGILHNGIKKIIVYRKANPY